MKLFEDVHEMKHLHKHVEDFKKALKEDLKSQDLKILKVHAEEFEAEIHDELARMLSVTRTDLDHYLKTLHSLAEFKAVMKELENKDPRFRAIVETELKYAKVIHEGLHQKLSALERLFHRMNAR
ncbi:MAG: hypothetical protein ABIJ21_02705 [Nanoarchaeota archaeon]